MQHPSTPEMIEMCMVTIDVQRSPCVYAQPAAPCSGVQKRHHDREPL